MTTTKSPKWVLILGASLLILSILFLMILVLIAVFSGKQVPIESRFLVIAILGITTGAGAGLLGGRAQANGNINIPVLNTPVKVGVTGGLATMIIILLLGNYLYPSEFNNKEKVDEKKEAKTSYFFKNKVKTLYYTI